VLAKAVQDFLAWRAKGLNPPRVAVNVSPSQLREKDFVTRVEQVLTDMPEGVRPLAVEITEHVIMQEIEDASPKLQALRAMGVEVAIDDFGTGYSSLSYIAKLPINTLKIDHSFVRRLTGTPNDLSIVSSIISLAQALGLRVVAEGVETAEQANLLRLLSCHEIQGHLISPAVPAEQIDAFLRGHRARPRAF